MFLFSLFDLLISRPGGLWDGGVGPVGGHRRLASVTPPLDSPASLYHVHFIGLRR